MNTPLERTASTKFHIVTGEDFARAIVAGRQANMVSVIWSAFDRIFIVPRSQGQYSTFISKHRMPVEKLRPVMFPNQLDGIDAQPRDVMFLLPGWDERHQHQYGPALRAHITRLSDRYFGKYQMRVIHLTEAQVAGK